MDEKKEKKQKKGFFAKVLAVILSGVLFGAFAGTSMYGVSTAARYFDPMADLLEELGISEKEKISDKQTEQQISSVDTTKVIPTISSDTQVTVTDVSKIADAVMPSLVSIVNEYTQTQNFGYFGSYNQTYNASGSGIIVGQSDTELMLVTNYHVVENADRLEITFVDESTAEAKVKNSAKNMDLAVISVQLSDLTDETKSQIAIATLGDSDSLKVGEPAIAIGNALGYGQSVTTGVISALDRQINVESDYQITGSFIQTDAAINPGNSGGALLNIKGDVIGINSSKIGGSTVEGMGYAIPISAAKPIIEDLVIKAERTAVTEEERGYLGVTVMNATDYLYSENVPKGAYIDKVNKNSAADNAGLMAGDIIVQFGEDEITSLTDLQDVLGYYKQGQKIVVKVQRRDKYGEYKELTVDVTLQGKSE